MAGYFSFDRLITPTIVKIVHFLGFLILSAAGITLIVWAGLRLNDANIAREQGWRYVAIGAAALVVGNLAWRVICEFWMVLFNMHDQLASLGHATIVNTVPKLPETHLFEQRVAVRDRPVHSSRADVELPREVPSPDDEHLRTASVLGLT
jgi:uncharacterized protein DUF4282